MKTQIRPRVLIPVIALAVAVGAAAVWKLSGNEEPSPSAESAEQVGGAANVSALPVQPADVATASGDWASRANAICAAEITTASGDAGAASSAAPSLDGALAARRETVSQLRALTAPGASSGGLDELTGILDQQVTAATGALNAVGAGKAGKAKRMLQEISRLEKRGDALATSLGLGQCAEDREAGIEAMSMGQLKFATAFAQERALVLVLHSSSATLDAAVLREARVAATDAGAAFVALDGTKEKEGGAVARAAGLRATPSTVVFSPTREVVAIIPGFADRQTIAQAVANARTPAPTS